MPGGLVELARGMAFLVDNPAFSPNRAYMALALADGNTHESAEFMFITERGEVIFVPTHHCSAVEGATFSQPWPNTRRGRRARAA